MLRFVRNITYSHFETSLGWDQGNYFVLGSADLRRDRKIRRQYQNVEEKFQQNTKKWQFDIKTSCLYEKETSIPSRTVEILTRKHVPFPNNWHSAAICINSYQILYPCGVSWSKRDEYVGKRPRRLLSNKMASLIGRVSRAVGKNLASKPLLRHVLPLVATR